jgi:hypothetical protein
LFRQVIAWVVARVWLNADNTKAARIAMTAMATSNSINVNAREALIEYALQRISTAYHRAWSFANHFFQDFACRYKEFILPAILYGATRRG